VQASSAGSEWPTSAGNIEQCRKSTDSCIPCKWGHLLPVESNHCVGLASLLHKIESISSRWAGIVKKWENNSLLIHTRTPTNASQPRFRPYFLALTRRTRRPGDNAGADAGPQAGGRLRVLGPHSREISSGSDRACCAPAAHRPGPAQQFSKIDATYLGLLQSPLPLFKDY